MYRWAFHIKTFLSFKIKKRQIETNFDEQASPDGGSAHIITINLKWSRSKTKQRNVFFICFICWDVFQSFCELFI